MSYDTTVLYCTTLHGTRHCSAIYGGPNDRRCDPRQLEISVHVTQAYPVGMTRYPVIGFFMMHMCKTMARYPLPHDSDHTYFFSARILSLNRDIVPCTFERTLFGDGQPLLLASLCFVFDRFVYDGNSAMVSKKSTRRNHAPTPNPTTEFIHRWVILILRLRLYLWSNSLKCGRNALFLCSRGSASSRQALTRQRYVIYG